MRWARPACWAWSAPPKWAAWGRRIARQRWWWSGWVRSAPPRRWWWRCTTPAAAVIEAHGPRGRAPGHRGRRPHQHACFFRSRLAQPLLGADEHGRAGGWQRARTARRQEELDHLGRRSRQLHMVQPADAGRGRQHHLAGAGQGARPAEWWRRFAGWACAAMPRARWRPRA